MKTKYRIFSIGLFLAVGIICCAVILLQTNVFADDAVYSASPSFGDAIWKDGICTLDVDYTAYGDNFEIAKDITISTDRQLQNKVPLASNSSDGDTYTYTFELDESIEQLYVSAPVVYVPAEITPITVSLYSDSTNGSKMSANSDSLFTISSVAVAENSSEDAETVPVIVDVEPTNGNVPRLPELVTTSGSIPGITIHDFDDDGNFTGGRFIFFVAAESASDAETLLNEASITVSNVLVRADTPVSLFSSNTNTINVDHEN